MDDYLKPIRERIDVLDSELLRLLNERMTLVQEVGRIKAEKGLALFDPGREERIYERLCGINSGPLTEESLRAIFREIMAASRLLQHTLRVAFRGPEWTYSHLAALSIFGHSPSYTALPELEDVFDALLRDKAHVIVVPIENSLEGGVGRTLDLLHERETQVARECYLEIAYCIASLSHSPEKVERIYAPPQALGQCRKWLTEKMGRVERCECTSTGQALQKAKNDPTGALICNLYAALHHRLAILYERVEDHPGSVTRFFALSKRVNNSPTGRDRTSVLFAVSDQPGALHLALEPFVACKINLTRIESRPNRLIPWQHLFFVDIEGHREEEPVRRALQELGGRVAFLRVLGSYPKSDPKFPIRVEKETMRSSAWSVD
ncbi:MAG: prephenate dehydratase [Syntrophobacteraceae bacterium]